jgi:tripartite-type tricarboxylate transporter receptor subunit TctC
LGQQVIVDNRPGLVAIEAVAKAPPDGYTLLVNSNLVWILPLMQSVRFDPLKDLAPVILAVATPNVVVVHPSMPVKTIKDLIALAKAKPGQLDYSAGSNGSTPHLAAEMFKARTGVDIVHVPYKGAGPALTALVAGEVHVSFPGAGSATPHLKAGRLRALAITSAQPSALLPGVPTVASTLPGFETVAMYGLFAPAATPRAIVERLNQEVARGLKVPEIRERFLSAGVEPVGSTSEQFAATISSDAAAMDKVIKAAGIRAK